MKNSSKLFKQKAWPRNLKIFLQTPIKTIKYYLFKKGLIKDNPYSEIHPWADRFYHLGQG